MTKPFFRIMRILFRIVAWIYWIFVAGCLFFFSDIWYAPVENDLPPWRLPTLEELAYNIYHYFSSGFFINELLVLWVLFIPAIIYFYLRFLIRRCIR